MITIDINEDRGMSNTKYHKCGKPNWWIAYTTEKEGSLNFVKIPAARGDRKLVVSVEIPDAAHTLIIGIKGCGKVTQYDVDEFREVEDVPAVKIGMADFGM